MAAVGAVLNSKIFENLSTGVYKAPVGTYMILDSYFHLACVAFPTRDYSSEPDTRSDTNMNPHTRRKPVLLILLLTLMLGGYV